jgi:hypothetical protein
MNELKMKLPHEYLSSYFKKDIRICFEFVDNFAYKIILTLDKNDKRYQISKIITFIELNDSRLDCIDLYISKMEAELMQLKP